jgi:hypothetical protein
MMMTVTMTMPMIMMMNDGGGSGGGGGDADGDDVIEDSEKNKSPPSLLQGNKQGGSNTAILWFLGE